MCTSISYKNFYGRNLDLEYELNSSKLIITPKNYSLYLKASNKKISIKYSLIGIGMVINDYPLFYDAMNDQGLYMAGLNFENFAKYFPIQKNKNNITPFEFIPYILGTCSNMNEVKSVLKNINLINVPFNNDLNLSPLHWMISDRNSSIVVEQVAEGLRVYDNEVGVLTNNPEFSFQLMNLNNFINISPKNPNNNLNYKLKKLSNGLGTNGLPGGFSSVDRFIRAAYIKLTSVSKKEKNGDITQFFHILNSVNQTRGSVLGHDERYEITIYSNCYSPDNLTMYFKTYHNNQLRALSLNNFVDEKKLLTFDFLNEDQQIKWIK